MISEGGQDGLKGARVVHLAESPRRSSTHFPALVPEGKTEDLEGGGADPDEGIDGSFAHRQVRVSQGDAQGLDRTSIADLAEGPRGSLAHAPALVFECADERLQRAAVSRLSQSLRASLAHIVGAAF